MKSYQLTLLLSPVLNEEELAQTIQKATSVVQELGGIIEKQDMPKRIALGASIQKQGEAHVCTVSFAVEEQSIPQLQQSLKRVPALLRCMVQEAKKIAAKRVPAMHKMAPARPIEEPKVAPEEIDKKLEEIFKQTPL
ncbi:MAG: 30S ribosomal protein S6 [Candidatus Wildermuthbacteria bacterium]|nr:30S ribosomal protein S6 [Candidatus Wildermuthbacteria bacterium]